MTDRPANILEIRRHAKRNAPLANLTTEGVTRARRASACERTYARVVTSQLPRAVQTAVAMGPLVGRSITLDANFADIRRAIRWVHTAARASVTPIAIEACENRLLCSS